jgi:hypothetical protein
VCVFAWACKTGRLTPVDASVIRLARNETFRVLWCARTGICCDTPRFRRDNCHLLDILDGRMKVDDYEVGGAD